jgi:hypothetical protein
MRAFADLGDIAPIAIWEHVLARLVEGDQCSLAVRLDPDSVVAGTAINGSSASS